MIVTAVIRYGGCEVVAPWTLLFGRHYVQGLWELVMLVGLLYATGRMVISIVRRRQTR